jgi:hypothetical protein
MRARIPALILSLIVIAGAGVVTAAPAQAATGDAATVFSLTNAQRTKVGLKPLISDAALDEAAQAWAQQLAKSCTFTHSTSSWRAARVASAGWSATGENIAAGYATPSAVVTGWMGSPGHKANILDSRYTGVGIGFAKGTCYSSYWVQIFGWTKTAGVGGAGDVNGDFDSDVVAIDSNGQLLTYRGSGAGGWDGTTVSGTGWQPSDKLVTLGDFTGDGVADVGRIRANGDFELLRGNGSGGYAAPAVIGRGWNIFPRVLGGIDFDGDRRTDVLAVNAAGKLMLYRGDGTGKFSSGTRPQIGSGWAAMTSVFYAGDFNGDSRGDIIARRSNGTLWLYPTTGTSRWGTAKQIGQGWNSMTAIFSAGDFDGSGKPDVFARRSDGSLALYRGNGKGGWGTVTTVGSGWSTLTGLG